jgi:two-component system, OmpR family, sensor histidine kinase KdpD
MLEWAAWCAVLAIATAGMLAIRARLNEAHVALAYLLIVQGASVRGGRPLGIALAAAAFVCFDLFFLPPFGTLGLQNPLNWLVLIAFLASSLLSAELLYRAQAGRAVALEQAHRAKDVVLASVSHDLRTPLTTIKGLAHQIAEDGDDRAMAIEEEADRLTALVAQLLDLSRITSGAAVPHIGPNEAEDLLGAAAQQASGGLAGRELRVAVMPGNALLFGRFDFSQTLRALVNLIENAAKYSPPGSPVDVTAGREGRWLVFAVSDRGPGVPPTERERIFEPFYRPAGRAPDVAGAGLGLSIAKGIAEAQGGGVTLEERAGGGTTFSLRVPAIDEADLVSAEEAPLG